MLLGILFIVARMYQLRGKTSRAISQKNEELERAMNEVETLRGILPICSYCKDIRDDKGSWQQLEHYITDRSDAAFSHGICPGCLKKVKRDEALG